ncbi:MAG: type II toxin-antitoxin system RelB/DinJ family antitoxin [Coriobacteriia bacterium]|nr:type II toxin-antitoxin system RelB/DinJ family antitoxin [Coriobacteriia bacterium]
MAQTSINIRTDENLKVQFDSVCNELGLNLSAAINVFMRAVVREREIPFKISAAPSFMVNTREELRAKIDEGLADIEAGRVRPAEEVFRDLEEKYGL